MKQKTFLIMVLWLCLVCVGYMLKFTIPLGEQSASLSCLSIALPLIAYFFSFSRSLPLVGGVWLFIHLLHPIPITLGIPTLLATLSWQTSHRKGWGYAIIHCMLPLVAMFLFAASTTGRGAWPYTLYWLIPVACSFMPLSLFTRALQSTFIAHAAGSVIWVYLVPLSSQQWIALIPVVAVERLLAAVLACVLIKCLIASTARETRGDKKRAINHC